MKDRLNKSRTGSLQSSISDVFTRLSSQRKREAQAFTTRWEDFQEKHSTLMKFNECDWIDFPVVEEEIAKDREYGAHVEDLFPVFNRRIRKVDDKLREMERLDFGAGQDLAKASIIDDFVELNAEAVQHLLQKLEKELQECVIFKDSLLCKYWKAQSIEADSSSTAENESNGSDYKHYPDFKVRATTMESSLHGADTAVVHRSATINNWDSMHVVRSLLSSAQSSLCSHSIFICLLVWLVLTTIIFAVLHEFVDSDEEYDPLTMPRSLQMLVAFLISLFLGRNVTLYYSIRTHVTGLLNSSKTVGYWLSTWSDSKREELPLVQQLFTRWAVAALKLIFFECGECLDNDGAMELVHDGLLTHHELDQLKISGVITIASAETLWTWIGQLLYWCLAQKIVFGKGHEMACRTCPLAIHAINGIRQCLDTPLPSSYTQVVILITGCYLALLSFITAFNLTIQVNDAWIPHASVTFVGALLTSYVLIAILNVGIHLQNPFIGSDKGAHFKLRHFEEEINVGLIRQFDSQENFEERWKEHFENYSKNRVFCAGGECELSQKEGNAI